MSDTHVEATGIIISTAHNIYKVKLEDCDEDTYVLCTIGGKLRMHKINLMCGDRVHVKLSPYDMSRGIIAIRL